MAFLCGAFLHAALFGMVAVVPGFELTKISDSGVQGRNFPALALFVYMPLLVFVVSTALALLHWARRGRSELVVLELVFLLLGFLLLVLVVETSSMR